MKAVHALALTLAVLIEQKKNIGSSYDNAQMCAALSTGTEFHHTETRYSHMRGNSTYYRTWNSVHGISTIVEHKRDVDEFMVIKKRKAPYIYV